MTPLCLGSTPVFIENPFTPKGHEISIEWRKETQPSYFQRFNEGGKSSEKLYRCGMYWRKVTFFDANLNRQYFHYGYANTKAKKPEESAKDALAEWYKEYEARQFLQHLTPEAPETETHQEHARRSERTPEEIEQEREHDKQRRKRKQEQALKNLVNKNYLCYMYTLTFALECNEKVKGLRFILPEDQQRARKEIERAWNLRRGPIVQALRERDIEFRYVKVLEKHDSDQTDERKRGTYHIHLATDQPIDKYLLQKLWGFGVVWVDNFNKSKVKDADGNTVNVERDGCVISPGDYMAKYIDKDFNEADELGKRAYSPSKNLERVKPDRDETQNARFLQKPSTGFSDFDKAKIEETEPGLFRKIEAITSAADVKVFDKLFPVEFTRIDKQTGEPETVNMFVQYEDFNFRLLMKNARAWNRFKTGEKMQILKKNKTDVSC